MKKYVSGSVAILLPFPKSVTMTTIDKGGFGRSRVIRN